MTRTSTTPTTATTTYGIGGAVPQIIAVLVFIWFIRRVSQTRPPSSTPALRSVVILVLGDVGRSPRMMYHAASFAREGFLTYLIGYSGSALIPSLRALPNFQCIALSEPPHILSLLPFIISAPFKIAHQIISILVTLLSSVPHPPEFILVQNPPSIPTLALVYLAGWARGSKVIIDWHNLGYSILALRLGIHHPIVRLAKWFEAYFGRTAYAHLFVTQAMHDHLVKEWDLRGHKAVLYDRPPAHFHRCTPEELHELFVRLRPSFSIPNVRDFLPSYTLPYSTPYTTTSPTTSGFSHSTTFPSLPSPSAQTYTRIEMPRLREDRPALLVSSTSWTPDEDFSILLDALTMYEQRARTVNSNSPRRAEPDALSGEAGFLPKLLAVVTGRGDGRARYMAEVERRQKEEGWEWVRCVSLWLEAEDYPLLLGSADLGVSLHASSSALDLPMKVVDMFGCGLPVCALDFACLSELVKDGVNGLVFKDASQLAQQLENLLTSFPTAPALEALRSSLIRASAPTYPHRETERAEKNIGDEREWSWTSWVENWDVVVRPLVLRDRDGYHREWTR